MAYSGQEGWKHADKLDWKKTSVGGRKAAPAGLYTGKIEKATPKLSSTDKPMIESQIKMLRTEDPECEDGVGCIVFDNLMFSDESKDNFRTKNLALVLEMDLPESNRFEEVKEFAEEIVGKTVPVMIRGDAYKGKATAKVDYYGEEPPVDPDEANGKGRPAREERGGKSKGEDRTERRTRR